MFVYRPLIQYPREKQYITNLIEAFCEPKKLQILTNIEIGKSLLIEISGPVDKQEFSDYLDSVNLVRTTDIFPGFTLPNSLECYIKLA